MADEGHDQVDAGRQASARAQRCANCGIDIDAGEEAVVREDRRYCCEGCADGGPCIC